MAPVILQTYVHCTSCAGRIRRAIKKYLGVEEVWVSVDTGLVVVAGTSLDAPLYKWRIEKRTKRRVAIVSDGGAQEPPLPLYAQPPPGYPYHPYYSGMTAYGQPPPPAYPHPYGAAVGWVPSAAPPQHLLQYVPSELLHTRRHQYMANEAAMWINDDHHPNGCCSVQ